MSELQEFMVYEIEQSGDRKHLDIDQKEIGDYLHPERVFIIVREDLRRIYLWNGAKSPARKRFIGSRIASEVQGDMLKEAKFHRCKVVTVDQGDEIQEFLNVFGLESMEVEERLEDMRYIRNSARERMKEEELFSKKVDILQISSKMDEIRELLAENENILWYKTSNIVLESNWLKSLLKNEKYKGRVKNTEKADEIEIKKYEIRCVITKRHIFLNHIFNRLYDFSDFSEKFFKVEGDIAILNLDGVASFCIEKGHESYDIWFNLKEHKDEEDGFLLEGLTQEEYDNLIDLLTIITPYRVEVPKNIKLKHILKN